MGRNKGRDGGGGQTFFWGGRGGGRLKFRGSS